MKKIWIIGSGHFGLNALRILSGNNEKRHFVLVDPVRKNLEQPNCTLEQADGAAFLAQHLYPGSEPDWIIPALPVHLAAEWCLLRMGREQLWRISLPEIKPLLPNPVRGEAGDIYVSHATFRCPDDCAEPRRTCTVTGKSRKQNMFDILKDIRFPLFQSLVIRSFQLAPGVGGYAPGQLFELLNQVKNARNDLLISTACRCHGVVTGLRRFECAPPFTHAA
ncbi:potassium transporter [Desulfococcaceae bacterium HSG8]|nr:potassium transporter [Desulfococcaceae bacterium HSG8]